MSLRVLLLRHAETAWNRERRYQGWTDTPLSAAGLQQAEAAARELKEHPFVAVYSSPLQRARETAAPIAFAHGLEVVTPCSTRAGRRRRTSSLLRAPSRSTRCASACGAVSSGSAPVTTIRWCAWSLMASPYAF